MVKLAIGGFKGRMGQRVMALAQQDPRFEIVAQYDQEDQAGKEEFEVLVDFSLPEGTMKFLGFCRQRSAALVTGTTGFDKSQEQILSDAAQHIPVLKAANFSLGINWLLRVIPKIAGELSDNFDIEIVETHHTRKVDAPSGTAKELLAKIMEATGRTDHNSVVYGRQGKVGQKDQKHIGVHAIRTGDVVGRHEIIFGGTGESISIKHQALSRDTFAKGALEAATWLAGETPGLYSMADLLRG